VKLSQRHRKKKRLRGGEEAVIRQIARSAKSFREKSGSPTGLRLGIGDDAGLWRPRVGFETILTSDWFLEGTHFLKNLHPPDAVGWKSLARAVSDVAAMGGEPRCFLLNLALPENCTGKWLAEFLGGLRRASRTLGCALLGGDTTRRNEILINITVAGEVRSGEARLRSGARAGDRIFASARLGEAELGWKLLLKDKKARSRRSSALVKKHLYPELRTDLGRWLAKRGIATAMMDLSDGLSSDLPRLCAASEVGARIHLDKLPLSAEIFGERFSKKERVAAALHGGDDYELLFCVAKRSTGKIPKHFSGIALTEIGEITSERSIHWEDEAGKLHRLTPGGWDPFRK
jgi:thiamine-monophosphate kinase